MPSSLMKKLKGASPGSRGEAPASLTKKPISPSGSRGATPASPVKRSPGPGAKPAAAAALAAKPSVLLTALERALHEDDGSRAQRHARRAAVNRVIPQKGEETAVAWTFNDKTKAWACSEMVVSIATEWFAEGVMRQAFRMVVAGPKTAAGEYVAKLFGPVMEQEFITPDAEIPGLADALDKRGAVKMVAELTDESGSTMEMTVLDKVLPPTARLTRADALRWYCRLTYFRRDLEMQAFCQTYADEFNRRKPPKRVTFLPAFLLTCHKRPQLAVYFCEPRIDGLFVKYNNNEGIVDAREVERNTPQAFSHFSYVHSRQTHMIVDIQGVGDLYTDPQVHSISSLDFGLGNLGQRGIDAFFRTHRCNNICVNLGLADATQQVDNLGTVFGRKHVQDRLIFAD